MRRRFKPPATRPNDFEAFWQSTRMQLERPDPEIQRQPLGSRKHKKLTGEQISFLSLGNVRVHAYFLQWQDDKPRPLVVYSHGYGGHCRARWDWVRAGNNVLGVDIRGFGISRQALPNPSRWGYVLTGVETPETSILRRAVCDYMQAARVAARLLKDRVSRTVFHGVSFAGALALMAEAVLQQADLLAVGVPTFGWAEGRHFFVKSGSGQQINQYLAQRPEHIEDVMLVLRYFDTLNFAERVTCPTVVGVGLSDNVVPAKTVYPVANYLGGPHELIEFPVSHSDHPEEQLWGQFEQYWLKLAREGVSPHFGQQRITSVTGGD